MRHFGLFPVLLTSVAIASLVGLATARGADEPQTKTPLSVAYLSVEPRVEGGSGAIDLQAVSIEQHTQAALLKSPTVFFRAFTNDKGKLRNSKWFRSLKTPNDDFQTNTQFDAISGANPSIVRLLDEPLPSNE